MEVTISVRHNPILITYRSLKRLQKWAWEIEGKYLNLNRRAELFNSIQEDIENSLDETKESDLCPVLRFIVFWIPLQILFRILLMLGVGAVLTLAFFLFTTPLAELWQLVLKVATAIGLLVLLCVSAALVWYLTVFQLPRVIPKPVLEMGQERVIWAKGAVQPIGARIAARSQKAGPVIREWMKSQHDRFCIRIRHAA